MKIVLMFKLYYIVAFSSFLLLLNSSCGTKVKVENGFEIKTERKERISIVGTAEDAKGGAIVYTDNDEVYYIGRKKNWSNKRLNQKVKVTGRLVEISYNKLDSNRVVQERNRKRWIKRPIVYMIKSRSVIL